MPPKIPAYPVVHARLAADGSAHVSVAGNHRNYPAGPVDATREQIIAYAVEVAVRLGRGVRMISIDPAGRWDLVVYPDGNVASLEQPGARRRVRPAPPTEQIATISEAEPPVPLLAEPEAPQLQYAPASQVATLRFTTGDVAQVVGRAVIGREPEAAPEAIEEAVQHIEVADTTKTMSRLHAEVVWNGGRFWLIDRGSGNGTFLYPNSGKLELRPHEPVEVADGDTIEFGPVVRAAVTFNFRANPGVSLA